MNKAQLRRAVGLAWTTVSYHLLRLERKGAVHLERKNNVTLCFPIGIPSRFRPWLALLQDPDACRVLDALGKGRRSVTQISQATGLSEPVVRRHLKRMMHAGIVTQRGKFRPRYSTDVQTANR
jgi:DNA-binding transcriptional ArsR family regulator